MASAAHAEWLNWGSAAFRKEDEVGILYLNYRPKTNRGITTMNTEVKFLRAVTDRKCGDLVIYYRGSDGKIKVFFPMAAIEMYRSRRDEIISAERYTNGDRYIALPPDSMIYASEENTRYFYDERDVTEAKKM
jgi:hypothetical protein